MFIKADTDQLKTAFKETVLKSWREYDHDFTPHGGEQYLITDPDDEKEFIGTIEFTRYKVNESYVDDWYPYAEDKIITDALPRVVQISNVSVVQEYRGKHALEQILAAIKYYGDRENTKYFIGIINPLLYKILKIQYHLPIIALSDPIEEHPVPGMAVQFDYEQTVEKREYEDLAEELESDLKEHGIKDKGHK